MNFFHQMNILLAWTKFQCLMLENTRKLIDEKKVPTHLDHKSKKNILQTKNSRV